MAYSGRSSRKKQCRHILPVKGVFSIQSPEGKEEAEPAIFFGGCDNHRCLQGFLKECGREKDLTRGSRLHAYILKQGQFQDNISVSNSLITMYAKCGAIAKAQEVFDGIPLRDVVSWNALITGYVQNGYAEEALNLLKGMERDGLSPDAVTFFSILKACGSLAAADKGKEIHEQILRKGLLEKRWLLGTALVDMYVKCSSLEKAREVFDAVPIHDVVSWNSLIAGFCQGSRAHEVLECFEQMKYEGLSPDAVTFVSVLKACGNRGAVEKGEEIHSEIVRAGLMETNCFLENTLMDMYAKCGAIAKVRQVFDECRTRDVVSWNILLRGNCQLERIEDVLHFFDRILCEGLCPDRETFSCILKACSCHGLTGKGKSVHAQLFRSAWLRYNNILGNALVDMYIKCGVVWEAQRVFNDLPFRDVVSWTTLLTGYAQLRQDTEALNCLGQMQHEGYSPDVVTYACILKSCGSLVAVDKGEKIHAEIVREGLVGKTCMLDTALVDMYAKCGRIENAQQVFDELPYRNVVSWTALIAGYAHIRKLDLVFNKFNKMIGEGVEPNLITFTVVLNACSYLGLVERGQSYFETMSVNYGIIPTLGHQACMVNLFAGSGHFDKAIGVIKRLPSSGYLPAWSALLGACRKWENVKLGRLAFEYAVKLDAKSAVPYFCMSSLYAASGIRRDGFKQRFEEVSRKPGSNWLTINANI